MKSAQHLLLLDLKPSPSAEWKVSSPGWLFLRVDAGTMYWLGRPQVSELGAGDVFVACPGRSGLLRASRLGEAALQYFHFRPELLGGFLTTSERQFFEHHAARADRALRLVPASEAFAQQFARIAAEVAGKSAFVQRCELLALAGQFFAEDVDRYQSAAFPSSVTAYRFKRFIEEMPEAEFVNRTPQELARSCGYSSRHFGRLFRQHFHTTIRAKQTELRLVKARQLLSNTDAKIVHVALESGFRHLGLFNTAFKKRFGMTPSEWRKRNAKTKQRRGIRGLSLLGIVAALLWLVLSCRVDAAEQNPAAAPPVSSTPGNAATNNQAARATATNTPAFEVRGYEIIGNTLFSYEDLLPIFSKYVGPAITFDTIRKALAELQTAFRDRGFVTVSVTLPQQQLTNGLVKVRVIEGRLVEINVVNNRFFSSNNIMRSLPSLRPGILLNGLAFQQDLDRANASRDRQLYPVIGPGPDPGTTALTLKVKDRLPLHGKVELNNFATPDTPDLRLNLALQYNNLWQREHQIGVQYSMTPEELKEDNTGAFYDAPLIANYSAFYRAPLSFVGAGEPTPTLGISSFGFDEATRRFRPPPARNVPEILVYGSRSVSDTGQQLVTEKLVPDVVPPEGALQVSDKLFNQTLTKTENLGLRFLDPLPAVEEIHSTLSVGPDYKWYRASSVQDRIFQATIFVPRFGSTGPPFDTFESPPTTSSRSVITSVSYLPLSVGWDASRNDKYGVTSFNFNYAVNFAELLDEKKRFRVLTASRDGDGNYHIVLAGMSREQKIYGEWGLRLHADGQWANQPLINNEQFPLGGNAGVRGYREGQEYGDTGWRLTFEPHTPSFNVGLVNKSPMYARGFAFLDYGRRYLLEPGPRQQSISLFGTGLGGNATVGQWLEAKLIFGLPILEVRGVTSLKPHVTFSLSFQF
jgi:hemolysin activation/secretion protein/AraC-like DNA-binding protein